MKRLQAAGTEDLKLQFFAYDDKGNIEVKDVLFLIPLGSAPFAIAAMKKGFIEHFAEDADKMPDGTLDPKIKAHFDKVKAECDEKIVEHQLLIAKQNEQLSKQLGAGAKAAPSKLKSVQGQSEVAPSPVGDQARPQDQAKDPAQDSEKAAPGHASDVGKGEAT